MCPPAWMQAGFIAGVGSEDTLAVLRCMNNQALHHALILAPAGASFPLED